MKNTDEVREVMVTREFDNSPQVVFEDWIYPNKFCKWWGPKDFTNPICTMHAREGGAILVHMQAPDGTVYPMKGLFHEISPPERIVLTTYALDTEGHPVLEVLNTVTFASHDDKTIVQVRAQVINVKPEGVQYMAGMEQGWRESLDRLDELTSRVEW